MVGMAGCSEMDNYSVSPNHRLSFSADTVSFDTVFTTIGSTTGYFMIYNRNDMDLKIERILLANGKESGFRINVDGRKGDSFNDIPIWKNDSLFVAVEVTVNPNDENSPFVIFDSILFLTNGIIQTVRLEAYGQNAYILRDGVTFHQDTTLTADKPYLVYDSIVVPENVTLNIEKGASFHMHNGAKWLIDGTLKANGTMEEPIIFRGDRLNRFSYYISYDQLPAQWNGLFFGASSFDNELVYTSVRNGISGLTFAESTPDRKKMTIHYSQIKNMDGNVLTAENCFIEAFNSEFSNASHYLVRLDGGKYQFTHCTMANYMLGGLMNNSATRAQKCLTLTNRTEKRSYEAETKDFPLVQAFFDNCIIDGNMAADSTKDYQGEIHFLTSEEEDVLGNDETFNYRFNHCIVKTKDVTNERFTEVLFKKSPTYIKGDGLYDDNRYDYIFDFRLAEESIGLGQADRAIAEEYPTDMYGINRLASVNGPSIGAYEFLPRE